ncbi:MAG: sulfite exporter TauE/SafE family protein [Desulfarculus sp.]|nr:sulfite exporter TauE/SafE family protein [Desulfarculus sp.]
MRTTCGTIPALLLAAILALGALPALAAEQTAPAPAAPAAKPAAPISEKGKAILAAPAMPDKIKAASEKSLKDEKQAAAVEKAIDPAKPAGFLGIPGAPDPSLIGALLWALWVGWIFSTVGAFGGIMAGVGHITVFGLGDYANSFGKGHPVNKMLTDSIRVSNQWLVGLSSFISSFNYFKMGRLVLPLGAFLAIGSMVGGTMIPWLTAGKVDLRSYIGYFGLLVFLVGFVLLYETTPKGQAGKKKAKEAAAAFEKKVKEGTSGDEGVKVTSGSTTAMFIALGLTLAGALFQALIKEPAWVAQVLMVAGLVVSFFGGTTKFTFYGVEFEFKAYLPVLGGLIIAALSSFIGVGGGFLYVPYLTSVAGLPMFIVAGTSAMAVLVSMIASIFSYMVGQAVVTQWSFIGLELIGIFAGSIIGPRTSKYIPDIWLKRIFVVIAFYVGARYLERGFFGTKFLP